MIAVYNLQKQLYPDGPVAEQPAAIPVEVSSGDKMMETEDQKDPAGGESGMWRSSGDKALGLEPAHAPCQRGDLNLT